MIFELLIGCVVFVLLIIMIGAIFYDIDEIRKQRDYKQHPFRNAYKRRPLISIIILSSGDPDSLRRCIDSVDDSTYKKFEVIVLCSQHIYRTKKLLRYYPQIRLSTSHLAGVKAVQSAYRHYGRGDNIVIIKDTTNIDTDFLRRIVWHYNAESQPDVIVTNRHIVSHFSSTGLFLTYYLSLLQLNDKMKSAFQIQFTNRIYGSMVKKEALLTGHTETSYFAADIAVSSSQFTLESMPTISRLSKRQHAALCALRVCVWVTILITLGYFAYMATLLRQPILLFLSIASLGVMIICAVYSDNTLTTKQKYTYIALSPSSYVAFYFLSFSRIISEVRAMIHIKHQT